jgi:hypothetical protein
MVQSAFEMVHLQEESVMKGSMRFLAAVVVFPLIAAVAAANFAPPGLAGKGPAQPAQPQPLQPGGQLGGFGNGKPINEDMGKVLINSKGKFVTTFDSKAKRARLVIPQKMIAAKAAEKEKEGAQASAAGHNTMAGVALSLGLVTGGLWWARRGTGALGKAHIAILVTAGVLAISAFTASALWADLAPFPGKDKGKGPGPGLGFGPGLFGGNSNEVDIEITEKGTAIYYVIPLGNLGNPFGPNPGGGLPGLGPNPGAPGGQPLIPPGGNPGANPGLPGLPGLPPAGNPGGNPGGLAPPGTLPNPLDKKGAPANPAEPKKDAPKQ